MPQDSKPPDRESGEGRKGLSRRGFLASVGAGAAGAAVASQVQAQPAAPQGQVVPADDVARITLRINGRSHRMLVEPRWNLLHVLREEVQLTGTKVGCDRGECGACTVLIDGIPRYSCMTLAVEAQESEIETVEGLMNGEALGDVQQAFLEEDAYQCGYCTPGQIMAVEGLLRTNPNPSLDEIRQGVSGNLCRCGAYPHIFNAVTRAAELKRGAGGGS